MSEELISTLFHQSQQISEEKFRLRKSSGLGLVLCKEYIGLCGGKIWAESKGENFGSTFFFTIKSANDGGQN
jgi:signal transduction histidine kinase